MYNSPGIVVNGLFVTAADGPYLLKLQRTATSAADKEKKDGKRPSDGPQH